MTLEAPTRIAPPPWRPFPYDHDDRLSREFWDAGGGAGATYFDYFHDKAGNRTEERVGDPAAWTYYRYADDDSLTKHWLESTGAGTYYEYDKTGSCAGLLGTYTN